MKRRLNNSALALLLIACCSAFLRMYDSSPAQHSAAGLVLTNTEGQLALGVPLRLSEADIYELQLVPGISDAFSQRILEKREQILRSQGPRKQTHPLELVKGIGPKTAGKLKKWIRIE